MDSGRPGERTRRDPVPEIPTDVTCVYCGGPVNLAPGWARTPEETEDFRIARLKMMTFVLDDIGHADALECGRCR